ncbi:group II intron reverse transcriptase/maturase [Priestia megaterium]|uniref:group II intron reverse transcriptase/maturase n=1 Tax=Priestia megaterium TaxID=1404 RepID=UPI002E1D3428|nr:group II intron reverse transcriptase/maturase [Priestia megaterium]MED4253433.1 group II intron reverse transcriptase/maturase [Priestia megaterium]
MKNTSDIPIVSAATPFTDFNSVPWTRLKQYIRKLQQRIYRAESLGKKRKVKSLQRLLMRSEAALLLSIRQVTQLNKGKRTAGIDGFKATSSRERTNLYNKMRNYNVFTHNPSPALRKYIPKRKGEKLRPLGIPTMKDRVYQNIVKMALEPQWEVRFESISYGFRPKRGCHDAVEAVFNKIDPRSKKKWIFEGDFRGCFDNLNHNYIMEQVKDFPVKETVLKWLKAGFIDNDVFNRTEFGTPQGGIVSPLLANIALHGMEEELDIKYRVLRKKKGTYYEINSTRSVVKYADDFVILCESKVEAESMYGRLKPYLVKRGLELATDKTRVTHISEGFDFLGFNFRQYPTNKEKGRLWKLIIKPNSKSQAKMVEKVRECFRKNQGTNVANLIAELNPIIRGYANYWRTVSSKKIFSKMDAYVWSKTKRFLERLHPKKSWKWIIKQYFQPDIHGQSKNKWILTDPIYKHQLVNMSLTPIVRHEMVKYKNSPFDSNLTDYYQKRDIKLFEKNNVSYRQKLAKKQKHKCPLCQCSLLTEEGLEKHHRIPKFHGGTNEYKNLWLVHISCHILWHKTFPAKGKLPSKLQTTAFTKMLRKHKMLTPNEECICKVHSSQTETN